MPQIRRTPRTVSYTHLDVYKRQAENYAANDRFYSNVVAAQIDAVITNLKNAMAPFVCKYLAVPTTAGSNEGVSVTESASPVSYTHLVTIRGTEMGLNSLLPTEDFPVMK